MKQIKSKKESATDFDFKEFEREAIRGLQSGASLFGELGILKSLVKRLVEAALEGEMDGHLSEERAAALPNKRNGYGRTKRLRTELGEIEVSSPRDRAGRFGPVTVGKWERQLGNGFEDQVRELYAMGNSLSDIRLHLEKMYGASLSEASLSMVTERVHAELKAWRERPLPAVVDEVPLHRQEMARVVARADGLPDLR